MPRTKERQKNRQLRIRKSTKCTWKDCPNKALFPQKQYDKETGYENGTPWAVLCHKHNTELKLASLHPSEKVWQAARANASYYQHKEV